MLDRSDNNEYYLRDDFYLAKNEAPHEFASPIEGKQTIGLLGRMINVRQALGYGSTADWVD